MRAAGALPQDGLRLKLTGSYSPWSYDVKRTLPYCMMSKAEREQATGTNFAQLCDDNADRALGANEKAAINRSIKLYGLQFNGAHCQNNCKAPTLDEEGRTIMRH